MRMPVRAIHRHGMSGLGDATIVTKSGSGEGCTGNPSVDPPSCMAWVTCVGDNCGSDTTAAQWNAAQVSVGGNYYQQGAVIHSQIPTTYPPLPADSEYIMGEGWYSPSTLQFYDPQTGLPTAPLASPTVPYYKIAGTPSASYTQAQSNGQAANTALPGATAPIVTTPAGGGIPASTISNAASNGAIDTTQQVSGAGSGGSTGGSGLDMSGVSDFLNGQTIIPGFSNLLVLGGGLAALLILPSLLGGKR